MKLSEDLWEFMGIELRYCIGLSVDHFLMLFPPQDEEERPRPEFAAKAPYTEKNPITGVREPYFPKSARLRRIAAGSGLIILMVGSHSHLIKDH